MQGARGAREARETRRVDFARIRLLSGLQFCHLFFFFFLSSLPLEEVEERRGVSKMLKASKFCGYWVHCIHHAFVTTLKPKLPWRCSKCDQAQKRIRRKRKWSRVRIHTQKTTLKYVTLSFAARFESI